MIKVNIDKAKQITHDARRAARSEEFKPLDVLATNPSMNGPAEIARQSVRDKYAVLQDQIDSCKHIESLKHLLGEINGAS